VEFRDFARLPIFGTAIPSMVWLLVASVRYTRLWVQQ
jgi:hypothetical protein